MEHGLYVGIPSKKLEDSLNKINSTANDLNKILSELSQIIERKNEIVNRMIAINEIIFKAFARTTELLASQAESENSKQPLDEQISSQEEESILEEIKKLLENLNK
ncbi:MAG: hypothetical protein QXX36_01250 [Candidatus Rehaiarchaeum fermentans]|nr:hypothetical protein [Candidatus Rehaiarchaeum fermentans]MCW1302238.1 hypothetical protein [Candidatus Rehaiarchaeum fermentans]